MHQITQIITFHLFLGQMVAQAQVTDFPKVGDPCPPFSFANVRNYPRPEITLTDFQGKKWLVLDFWAKTCRACIESFPKLNELQQEFRNDVQFLLVGDNSQKYNRGIEELYERQEIKHDLNLTAVFDSTYRKSFYYRVIPHLIIVDKQGTIYAITGSRDVTREKLQALVKGEKPEFPLKEE